MPAAARALREQAKLDDLASLFDEMLAETGGPVDRYKTQGGGSGPRPVSGAVQDIGALAAFERADRRVVAIVARAPEHGDTLYVPAGVVSQVWRDGSRQNRLARLLASSVCEVIELDDHLARAAGQLCGASGTVDVVDSSVVVTARERGVRIITSGSRDLRRLDPRIDLVSI